MSAALVYSSGGNKSTEAQGQTAKLIIAAQNILGACGYPMGPSRVSKLVRRFQHRVEGNGFAFFDFIANAIRLSEAQRRRALADPDIARIISYLDPTGETAVNNVLRKSGR